MCVGLIKSVHDLRWVPRCGSDENQLAVSEEKKRRDSRGTWMFLCLAL